MYNGIREIILEDEAVAQFYEKKYKYDYSKENLLINQYVVLKNKDGKIIQKGRWTKNGFAELCYEKINNTMFGEVEPKNLQQEFAFDLLQNDSITGKLLFGGFGSGKTMVSLVHALNRIIGRKPDFDRLIYLRNNIITKNTFEVGALPSDLVSKLKPFAMPMCDILGEETQLDLLIDSGKICLDHIGFIRGRSYRNSIVMVSEGQNITKEIAAIIVSRIGAGSILIVEGDVRQCDKSVFEKESGIYYMIEALKGDFEFGVVQLLKNERSRFASLSDKILEM